MADNAAVRSAIVERLADGESLASICRDPEMPAWSTVHVWIENDEDFAGQITRAREIGYQLRADRAILEAKTAEDAAKGRLAFDAERWYLGKLSNAFRDANKHEHSGKDGGPMTLTVLTGVPRDDADD
jgi:hypothetical protein